MNIAYDKGNIRSITFDLFNINFKYKRILLLLLSSVSVLFFTNCSSFRTSTEQYIITDNLVRQEKYLEAANYLYNNREDAFSEKDRALLWIDLALLYHYAGKDTLSVKYFSLAENAIEELYTKSISKAVGSMFMNDNALDYFGEDYENIYINIFKALAYYNMGSLEDAIVEIRRMTEKFQMLERRYKVAYKELQHKSKKKKVKLEASEFYSSALAHYLGMLLFLKEGDLDAARIEKESIYKAFDTEKNLYNFTKPNFDTLFTYTKNPIISFVTFLGKSPIKYEYQLRIDTYPNLVVISELKNSRWVKRQSMFWPDLEGGLHAKFAVPKLMKRGTSVRNVEVHIDGTYVTNLTLIESIENIAFDTFKREESLIFIKSLTRTITKAIANEALNKEIDKKTKGDKFLGNLTRLITGELINATENADLRITRYFPCCAVVGNVEVTPGNHNIAIIYKDRNNQTIAVDTFENVNIQKKGTANLFETVFLE